MAQNDSGKAGAAGNAGDAYSAADLAADLETVSRFAAQYRAYVGSRVVGMAEIIDRLFLCLLCEGNVLMEGAPGLGKTSMAKTWATFLGLDFKRVQFTPDLMPLDLIGSNLIETDAAGNKGYRFFEGPVFANVLLGDEINRATPKTQSALLEAMEEKRVTFLGESRSLPSPFFVIATQNPIELEGTYPLPEAQVDRFLMRLFFPLPDFAAMRAILDATEGGGIGAPAGREATAACLAAFARAKAALHVPEELKNFVVRLVVQTQPERSTVESVRKYVRYGASPRCAVGLLKAAKARAVAEGRPAPGFDDVEELFFDLANHRVILDFEAETDGVTVREVLAAVLAAVRREYRGAA